MLQILKEVTVLEQHNLKNKNPRYSNLWNLVEEDVLYLAILLVLIIIVLQIVYYKENLFVNIKLAANMYWLFVLPGYCIMLYWHEEMNFGERLVYGSIAGIGLLGIITYAVGLLGTSVIFLGYIFPPLCIILGTLFGTLRKD